MPRDFKAPNVYREEIDISDIIVPTGVSNGGTVVRAVKGRINTAILVSNDKEYIDTFGVPFYSSGTGDTIDSVNYGTTNGLKGMVPEYGYGAYAALEYLKESSNLYVVRAYSNSDQFAYVLVKDAIHNTSAYSASVTDYTQVISAGETDTNSPDTPDNITAIENGGVTTGGKLLVAATYPGTDGNNIAVTIEPFNVSADWKYQYDSYPTQTSATKLSAATSDVDEHFPIASKVFKMNVYLKKETDQWLDFVDVSNSTLTSKNALRITPVETWYGSLDSTQDADGNDLFIENVVNGNSKYIYVKATSGKFSYIESNSDYVAVKNDTLGDYVYYGHLLKLAGGSIDKDTGLNSTTGWNLFNDREYVNVNILICPDYHDTVKKAVANVASRRMDCIAVCQTGRLNQKTYTDIINSEKYGYAAPSYVSLYTGYSKIYDNYNDKFVYLPNSIFGAALMARVDRIANPWDAPAGINRGTLSVLDQNKIYSTDNIGKLYDKNINAVRYVRGVGHVMWGQKTAQLKKSALDRINVRRNLLYIENNIEISLLPFLFENNNSKTRLRVSSIITEFLETVQAGGGLESFKVVCDETNNTSQIIDSNQLSVDIYVSPSRAIEYILLRTIVTRSGISFEEVRL
jgi:hypothetical protein